MGERRDEVASVPICHAAPNGLRIVGSAGGFHLIDRPRFAWTVSWPGSILAEWTHIREVQDDYQAIVEHHKCNAIYIPLPISYHHEWTLKALEA